MRVPKFNGTLLVFLKAPVAGRVKTRLAASIGPEEAARAYRTMARTVRSQVSRLEGVRVVWVYAPAPEFPDLRWLRLSRPIIWRQSRGDLGRRLRTAFRASFREFSGPVCVVGTDSPTLTTARLREAFRALSSNDAVIGPTKDGGYYLLGMNAYRPRLLTGIHWSTGRVFEQTLDRMIGAPAILPVEPDVDTLNDWNQWKWKG